MAEILPILLEDIAEAESVNITFTASLVVGETLVDISITDYRENSGIVVSGANFSGQYQDSFDLGPSGLKYRDTRDNTYHVVGKFEDLPTDPVNAHVYEFTAPSPLETDYYYTVTLNYQYIDPLLPGLPDDRQIIQTFDQTVLGKWDAWAEQLRNYISLGA